MRDEIRIPFTNTAANFAQIAADAEPEILELLRSGSYINGEAVSEFENAFATYCGTAHSVGVANGTDALRLALQAVGVEAGSEIVTVSHTFVATVEAALELRATVRFVDVDPETGLMDTGLLREVVSRKTVAIVPVHLYGRPVDMDRVIEVADDFGCAVIEDCAQAHGATYKGHRVGSLGDIGSFSFYPTKNLGAAGDGGAITTSSGTLAEKVRILADHGSEEKYVHSEIGWNSRLDAVQAVILTKKLEQLEKWNRRRREIAELYLENLRNLDGITVPVQYPYGDEVFHLFAIRVANRDEFRAKLAQQGIGTGIHYPIPVHLQQPYSHLHAGGASLARSEMWANSELSLPMYPELTDDEVLEVCSAVKNAVSKGALVK